MPRVETDKWMDVTDCITLPYSMFHTFTNKHNCFTAIIYVDLCYTAPQPPVKYMRNLHGAMIYCRNADSKFKL